MVVSQSIAAYLLEHLNVLRLHNVACDLDLISSERSMFPVHQLVFTALNQRLYKTAVENAQSEMFDVAAKKKMILAKLTSHDMKVLVEFMYGKPVADRTMYDEVSTILKKVDMSYLLDDLQIPSVSPATSNYNVTVKSEPIEHLEEFPTTSSPSHVSEPIPSQESSALDTDCTGPTDISLPSTDYFAATFNKKDQSTVVSALSVCNKNNDTHLSTIDNHVYEKGAANVEVTTQSESSNNYYPNLHAPAVASKISLIGTTTVPDGLVHSLIETDETVQVKIENDQTISKPEIPIAIPNMSKAYPHSEMINTLGMIPTQSEICRVVKEQTRNEMKNVSRSPTSLTATNAGIKTRNCSGYISLVKNNMTPVAMSHVLNKPQTQPVFTNTVSKSANVSATKPMKSKPQPQTKMPNVIFVPRFQPTMPDVLSVAQTNLEMPKVLRISQSQSTVSNVVSVAQTNLAVSSIPSKTHTLSVVLSKTQSQSLITNTASKQHGYSVVRFETQNPTVIPGAVNVTQNQSAVTNLGKIQAQATMPNVLETTRTHLVMSNENSKQGLLTMSNSRKSSAQLKRSEVLGEIQAGPAMPNVEKKPHNHPTLQSLLNSTNTQIQSEMPAVSQSPNKTQLQAPSKTRSQTQSKTWPQSPVKPRAQSTAPSGVSHMQIHSTFISCGNNTQTMFSQAIQANDNLPSTVMANISQNDQTVIPMPIPRIIVDKSHSRTNITKHTLDPNTMLDVPYIVSSPKKLEPNCSSIYTNMSSHNLPIVSSAFLAGTVPSTAIPVKKTMYVACGGTVITIAETVNKTVHTACSAKPDPTTADTGNKTVSTACLAKPVSTTADKGNKTVSTACLATPVSATADTGNKTVSTACLAEAVQTTADTGNKTVSTACLAKSDPTTADTGNKTVPSACLAKPVLTTADSGNKKVRSACLAEVVQTTAHIENKTVPSACFAKPVPIIADTGNKTVPTAYLTKPFPKSTYTVNNTVPTDYLANSVLSDIDVVNNTNRADVHRKRNPSNPGQNVNTPDCIEKPMSKRGRPRKDSVQSPKDLTRKRRSYDSALDVIENAQFKFKGMEVKHLDFERNSSVGNVPMSEILMLTTQSYLPSVADSNSSITVTSQTNRSEMNTRVTPSKVPSVVIAKVIATIPCEMELTVSDVKEKTVSSVGVSSVCSEGEETVGSVWMSSPSLDTESSANKVKCSSSLQSLNKTRVETYDVAKSHKNSTFNMNENLKTNSKQLSGAKAECYVKLNPIVATAPEEQKMNCINVAHSTSIDSTDKQVTPSSHRSIWDSICSTSTNSPKHVESKASSEVANKQTHAEVKQQHVNNTDVSASNDLSEDYHIGPSSASKISKRPLQHVQIPFPTMKVTLDKPLQSQGPPLQSMGPPLAVPLHSHSPRTLKQPQYNNRTQACLSTEPILSSSNQNFAAVGTTNETGLPLGDVESLYESVKEEFESEPNLCSDSGTDSCLSDSSDSDDIPLAQLREQKKIEELFNRRKELKLDQTPKKGIDHVEKSDFPGRVRAKLKFEELTGDKDSEGEDLCMDHDHKDIELADVQNVKRSGTPIGENLTIDLKELAALKRLTEFKRRGKRANKDSIPADAVSSSMKSNEPSCKKSRKLIKSVSIPLGNQNPEIMRLLGKDLAPVKPVVLNPLTQENGASKPMQARSVPSVKPVFTDKTREIMKKKVKRQRTQCLKSKSGSKHQKHDRYIKGKQMFSFQCRKGTFVNGPISSTSLTKRSTATPKHAQQRSPKLSKAESTNNKGLSRKSPSSAQNVSNSKLLNQTTVLLNTISSPSDFMNTSTSPVSQVNTIPGTQSAHSVCTTTTTSSKVVFPCLQLHRSPRPLGDLNQYQGGNYKKILPKPLSILVLRNFTPGKE